LRWYFLLPPSLLALGLLLDSLSTYLALASGNAIEGNPLLSVLFSSPLGLPIFVFFKILGVTLAFYIAYFIRLRALWRQSLYALLLILCASFFLLTSLSNLSLAFGLSHGFFSPTPTLR
jgi:hypothetical protein